MALKKQIENAQGFLPDYHRISAVRYLAGKASVEITSHKDDAARAASKAPAGMLLVEVVAPADASRAELYALLKATDKFSGAEDV